MAKFNFFKLSKSKKIRYLFNSTSNDIYVLFLHGFKSDLEGNKPKALFQFCKSARGHTSSGRRGRLIGSLTGGCDLDWWV